MSRRIEMKTLTTVLGIVLISSSLALAAQSASRSDKASGKPVATSGTAQAAGHKTSKSTSHKKTTSHAKKQATHHKKPATSKAPSSAQ
jgi:hypothetical protein